MKFIQLILLLIFFFSHWLYAQPEWNHWVFGSGLSFDFSGGTLSATAPAGAPSIPRGSASISDASGDLLFYTDGETIWDQNHDPMPNGTGLSGCNSSSQSSIIMQKPGEPTIYYVFTIDCRENSYANGIQYSEVDMTLNAGLGDVNLVKNVPLQTGVAELVTVSLNPDGTFWVIAHGASDDTWYAFLITCDGIADPVISNAGWDFTGIASDEEEEGQLKASPDGTLLAYTYYIAWPSGGASGGGRAELLDFDQAAGVVSNARELETYDSDSWGCEFSENGQVLYVSYLWSPMHTTTGCPPGWAQRAVIYQYDISDPAAIPAAVELLSPSCEYMDNIGQLQRGPDGRIYTGVWGGINYDYIEFPNIVGTGCNYIDLLTLPIGFNGILPNLGPVHPEPVTCGLSVSLNPDTICEGECAELFATVTPGVAPYSFEWSPGIASLSDTVEVCPLVTTIYQVVVTDAAGLTDTATTEVVVLTHPVVDLGNDTTLCNGESLNLDAENPGAEYNWQDGSTSADFTVLSGGIYWVEVNNGACISADTIEVNYVGPSVDLGPDTSLCTIIDFTLDAGNPGAVYNWQDGSTDQLFTVSDLGTYYVTVEDTAGGCIAQDTITIEAEAIILDLGNDTLICQGASLTLESGYSGITHLWSDGSSGEVLIVDEAGTYWLEINEGFCLGADTILVEVQDPQAAFTADDFMGCAPEEITFTDLSLPTGEIVAWNWSFGDGSTASIQHPSNTYFSSGTYSVSLAVVTSAGCESDTVKPVDILIYPTPFAAFNYSPSSPVPGDLIQFDDLSTDAASWNWSFGDGNHSNLQHPTHTYHSAGNYAVSLVVENEICSDSVVHVIPVNEPLIFYVPNVFTPDGDLFNETFQPVFTSGYDPYDFHLTIFNRWGEIIFESYDASKGWNGAYGNGGLVIDDVYVWQIDVALTSSDERLRFTGHVSVLK